MVDNAEISVIPYDQEEIEMVLKQLMYDNGITDVVYEGSNISQLSSVISYIISTLNINTSINLQETLLPLASKRMNVLFGARQLGYEPHAKKSYRYSLQLKAKYQVDPDNPNDPIDTYRQVDNPTVDLIHNTKFVSGEREYWYTGPTIANFFSGISNYDIRYVNDPNNGVDESLIIKEIEVIEGTLATKYSDETLFVSADSYRNQDGNLVTKQDYILPYTDVEDSSIQAYLEYIDENGEHITSELRTKSDHFLIDETLDVQVDKFVRMENIILGYPTVFFEFAGFGNPVRYGTKISFELIQSSGANGEALRDFTVEDTAASELFEVDSYEVSSLGVSEESSEDIKENALVFHNTANRAVTRYDYITIAKNSGEVSEVDVWGGEDETPQALGHIWLSATPKDAERLVTHTDATDVSLESYDVAIGTPSIGIQGVNLVDKTNWYLLDEDAESIIDYLSNYKIMTMQLHHRHPFYIDFTYNVDVIKYDTSKSRSTVDKEVFYAIYNYFDANIEEFGTEYINSNLQRVIDTTLTSVSGVDYSVELQGVVFRDMVDTYYAGLDTPKNYIMCSLAFPFENMFNSDNSLNTDLVPRIDTPNFGYSSQALTVDYDLLASTDGYEWTTDIKYNGSVVGDYIVNRRSSSIDLKFDLTTNDLDNIFGTGDGVYARFDIVYPTSFNGVNMPFTKNTLPRLATVKFQDN